MAYLIPLIDNFFKNDSFQSQSIAGIILAPTRYYINYYILILLLYYIKYRELCNQIAEIVSDFKSYFPSLSYSLLIGLKKMWNEYLMV